jgi:hypothetical protein
MRADVIAGDGTHYAVSGVLARMIIGLCKHARQIETKQRGEVRFTYSDGIPILYVTEALGRVEGY